MIKYIYLNISCLYWSFAVLHSLPIICLSDCADASSVPDDSARAMSPVAR